MENVNRTSITGFIILGFSKQPHQQILISAIVLPVFVISILGNLGFLILMFSDHRLHKPMYFFLSNLSFLDLCNTTVTLSTMWQSLLKGEIFISFSVCMTQLYFFAISLSTEIDLLAMMAYDRYVAVCRPLHYPLIMNKRICIILVATSWIIGSLDEVPIVAVLSRFSFCGSNEIDHFFCDPNVLQKLSCTDTDSFEILVLSEGIALDLIPFLLTVSSYVFIITAILKIRSSEGRSKAFSTCSSHLTVVLLFYGSVLGTYISSNSMISPEQNKLFAFLYTVFIPMINPLIYSLRNKEVKNALRNLMFGK